MADHTQEPHINPPAIYNDLASVVRLDEEEAREEDTAGSLNSPSSSSSASDYETDEAEEGTLPTTATVDEEKGKGTEESTWEMDPRWGKKGSRFVRPIFSAARKYAKVRDSIGDFICHPWLTFPLFGSYGYRWWWIDINIIELVVFVLVFGGCMAAGERGNFGWATALITMLVVGTIPRNNVVRFIFGIPFERMIKYHRWCGYFLAVPLFIHCLSYAPDFFIDQTHITGTITWITYILIVATSIIIVRRFSFELFYFTHFLFFVYLIVAFIHDRYVIAFGSPGLVMYGIDLLLRVVRYFTTSDKTLEVVQMEEDMACLRLKKKFNYKAGQYAFVLIPSISRLQWHPYTISSAPQESTLTIHVKDNGSWSRAVTRIPNGKNITVKVDGPYGKVGIRYRRYKAVALFCAGAGITPIISVLKDIYFRKQKQDEKCLVERVYLFWSVPRVGCLDWFASDIHRLLANPLPNLHMELKICVSRTTKLSLEEGKLLAVPFHKGRLDLEAEFGMLKKPQEGCNQVAVLVCGPKQFEYGVRKKCIRHSSYRMKFQYHTETFDF